MNSPSRNPYTITRWILKEQQKYPHAKGDLTIILNSITLAVKIISAAAKGAGIFQHYGIGATKLQTDPISFGSDIDNIDNTDTDNDNKDNDNKNDVDDMYYDDAMRIRQFAQESLIESVRWCGKVSMIASTLNLSQPTIIKECTDPKYVLVIDPIDGKQNIVINASIGTIFGIYKVKDPSNPSINDLFQPGNDMVCSGYALYGDATVLVLTFGDDVNGFTLDPSIGEFVLTHKDLRCKPIGATYSINEGYSEDWDNAIKEYVNMCKKGVIDPNDNNAKIGIKKSRYIGCMVSDVHRTLIKGGVFMYPTNKKFPKGKLSLICECNALSFLVTAAGGRASSGSIEIGTITPTNIKQTTPIFIGSKNDVIAVEDCYKKHSSIIM